ncbi:damage repair protein [Culicoidibacter larvae]|nr:damage repair protein [Culicoidibacter larvae]
MTTRLVVADEERGGGTIVLAVSPALKALGVPGRCRLYEIQGKYDFIIAKPRMKLYMEFSDRIVNIFLKYVSVEDLYVYSVDESLLDLTTYRKFYNKSMIEIAQMIIRDIYQELHVIATAGIGQNMVMAKLALDLEGKKRRDLIAEWNYDLIPRKLWPQSNLNDIWGIGSKTAKKLYTMGIYNMGTLANYDPEKLKQHFGIIGYDLFLHANGMDLSKIQDKYKLFGGKHLNAGETLFQDYFNDEVLVLIREKIDQLCSRLGDDRIAGEVHLSVGYSKTANKRGFGRQKKLPTKTSDPNLIYETAASIFNYFYEEDTPVRTISVGLGKLEVFHGEQLDLFRPVDNQYMLNVAINGIKRKYGQTALFSATSLMPKASFLARSGLVGGHNA